MNGGLDISYEIALRWMPQDLTDDKSTKSLCLNELTPIPSISNFNRAIVEIC